MSTLGGLGVGCWTGSGLLDRKWAVGQEVGVSSAAALTQGVEGGDVLPHVSGLLGPRLPHQGVHVVPETETRHGGRVHGHGEQVLVAAQVHLRTPGTQGETGDTRDTGRHKETQWDTRRQKGTQGDKRGHKETQGTQGDTRRHNGTQGDKRGHKETQGDTGDTRRHQETQGGTWRHKETQWDTRRHKETKGGTWRHKETQWDTRRHKETKGDTRGHRWRFSRELLLPRCDGALRPTAASRVALGEPAYEYFVITTR
ncbi:hypothetical protein EYF80_032283 [Liparis tanakae]|uniref:Uncharacterized protein n=1 Tax=Liparis tanakae TaxID=230148 RepID=A0A4Z2GVI6_9TELE|nr:hypothetical protein EYF80_032283 [Liparis tanakae]